MSRILTVGISFLLVLFSACTPKPAVIKIEITSTRKAWGFQTSSFAVLPRDNGYWTTYGQTSTQAVEKFVHAVLASPIHRPNLENLGVTLSWLNDVAAKALQDVEKNRRLTTDDRKRFFGSFQNKQEVLGAIATSLAIPHTDDSSSLTVTLTLRDGTRIVLTSY